MLFSFPALAIILFILYAIGCAGIGAGIGAVVGLIVSLITRRGPRAIGWDALLGAVGVVAGLIGTGLIPWHQNTITYRIGNTVVRSTTRHYQYPYRIAFVVGALVPLIYELIRFVIEKRAGARTPAVRS